MSRPGCCGVRVSCRCRIVLPAAPDRPPPAEELVGAFGILDLVQRCPNRFQLKADDTPDMDPGGDDPVVIPIHDRIRTVQSLMGHSSVENTMIYLHVMKRPGAGGPSPLDLP